MMEFPFFDQGQNQKTAHKKSINYWYHYNSKTLVVLSYYTLGPL